MERQSELVITLRTVRFEERHQIVTGLTENLGKIQAIARNSVSSRRFGGTLEPGTAALWHFVDKPGSDLARLEEAEIRREFKQIRASLEKLSSAAFIIEMMMMIAPDREPVPELFKLLANALTWLDETPERTALPRLPFFISSVLGKILQASGSHPRIGTCESCQQTVESFPADARFAATIDRAGILCWNCGAKGRANSIGRQALLELLFALGHPLRKGLDQPLAATHEHRLLFQLLEEFLIHHIPGFDSKAIRSRTLLMQAFESANPGKS